MKPIWLPTPLRILETAKMFAERDRNDPDAQSGYLEIAPLVSRHFCPLCIRCTTRSYHCPDCDKPTAQVHVTTVEDVKNVIRSKIVTETASHDIEPTIPPTSRSNTLLL